MKTTNMFITEVDDVHLMGEQPCESARVGWLIETAQSEDRILGFEVKIVSITLNCDGELNQISLTDFRISVQHDYQLGHDKELMPRSIIVHSGNKMQISF